MRRRSSISALPKLQHSYPAASGWHRIGLHGGYNKVREPKVGVVALAQVPLVEHCHNPPAWLTRRVPDGWAGRAGPEMTCSDMDTVARGRPELSTDLPKFNMLMCGCPRGSEYAGVCNGRCPSRSPSNVALIIIQANKGSRSNPALQYFTRLAGSASNAQPRGQDNRDLTPNVPQDMDSLIFESTPL